jgi:RND family efflux transporter MFP subunit
MMELRAPIAGQVSSLGAGLGEPVAVGHKVFSLLDPEVLWIEARIPEASLGRLAAAKGARYEDPNARGRLIDIGAAGGRLVFTGLEVDPATRTVSLIYEVPNADRRLRVGQTLTLHVETVRAEEALAVPDSAIVEEVGGHVAFVHLAGETFEKRELTLGIRDGDWVQVLAGLTAGERIVTRGAFAIRLASVANAIPSHGHTH